MSMPKFPDIDPEMTCDRALNMILASIAMEEVALSHILNAEGEKMQYVLGTLESSCGADPDVEEILKVNQSVSNLLDSISQNQMILKNKMDKALHALSEICPETPEPPCLPDPSCPPEPPCPPPPCPPEPACKCGSRCSAVLKSTEKCKIWFPDTPLSWDIKHQHGNCVQCDPCDETKIDLCKKGRFVVNFIANVKAKGCKYNAAVSLQMTGKHHHKELFALHSVIPCRNELVTISMNGIIAENLDHASSLFLKLKSTEPLMIEDSMLTIIEI